jgi:hypothetical protein
MSVRCVGFTDSHDAAIVWHSKLTGLVHRPVCQAAPRHEFADSESRIEVVDWARGSEADAEECVDRGEIPFGRSGPACRQDVDSGDGGRRVEVVHECGA